VEVYPNIKLDRIQLNFLWTYGQTDTRELGNDVIKSEAIESNRQLLEQHFTIQQYLIN